MTKEERERREREDLSLAIVNGGERKSKLKSVENWRMKSGYIVYSYVYIYIVEKRERKNEKRTKCE